MKLSIIIPVYNEELLIHESYKRMKCSAELCTKDFELIFVNDGSDDNTLKLLNEIANNDNQVKIISFSRNFGHQSAITAGMDYSTGECVVTIDADLQDPPELIKDMYSLWLQGYEIISAKRKSRKGETFFKIITAKYFYKFMKYLSESKIPENTADFKLMDRTVIDILKNMNEKSRYLRGLIFWTGFNQTTIEYDRDERWAGKTKYTLSKMIKLASNGIFAFSTKPLKFISVIGLFSIFFSFFITIYSLISSIFSIPHIISGWTSIIILITFLGGIQIFCIGIIGEYIARIFDETKSRPLYIVKKKDCKNLSNNIYKL